MILWDGKDLELSRKRWGLSEKYLNKMIEYFYSARSRGLCIVQTEMFNFGQNSQETSLNPIQGQLYFSAIGHPNTGKSRFASHKRCEEKKEQTHHINAMNIPF
jgi:hypothetical protein